MNQTPLMLSVSGLRGLIGQSLTPAVAADYGAAVGQWVMAQRKARGLRGPARVVVGRDSRPSGPMVESAACAGLISVGCQVTRLGIATTPGVAVMVGHRVADAGLVITASHNPIIWNGIKTLRHDGAAPPAEEAQTIIRAFQENRPKYVPVEDLVEPSDDPATTELHVDKVLARIDATAVKKRKPRVVLDSVCGAGGPSTAILLERLGAQVIHLHGEPTGRFPHPPEPTRANLTGLCEAVRKHGADVGFAQDPDADRLAVVDEKGHYIGEEYTLVLACLRLLQRAGTQTKGATLAANLSTSRMIDDVAAKFAATVLRTPVGEANVASAMRAHQSIAGGEGNGGIIWPVISQVRDSLAGIALVLELLAVTGQSVSSLVASTPAYAMLKDKADIRPGMAQQIQTTLAEKFKNEKLDTQDGLRIDFADRWVHVRPSNTEPIIRIIAEAPSARAAGEAIAAIKKEMGL